MDEQSSQRPKLSDQIEHWFKYHPPDPDQREAYEAIRQAGKAFALVVDQYAPDSADKTTAIRTIRESVMWANAAIACEGR